ncbi:putative F-box domain-containing protein [Helianthus annuus]|uniref:F-box domain-containing protein n=1 Tax=Helianthus annuus TaxID=4232 RepID=A0A251TZ65_HELAN|nr:putative F-box domain-containing protein [Helianthus annuus]KAJ0831856.1 putative F-box domain-containing protein [Helianthus annuus]
MPDNIPFEIQTEIMKRLPVKSLLRFRSVSKSCKSLIDSSDFIKHYIGQQQQHLLVRCYDCVAHFEKQSMSIVDDDSLPTQTASVTLPSLVEYPNLIGTSHGLFCFYGPSSRRAVIFNPCIRTTLAFAVPRVTNDHLYQTVIGFGVCRHTADPKIVKITLTKKSDRHINSPWQVEVFTVSTSTWRSAYSTNLPRNSISIYMNQVVVDGCLYWLAIDGCSYLIVSFDLTSEEFREVNLPDSLAQFRGSLALSLYKLRESLAVIKDGVEANKRVYHLILDLLVYLLLMIPTLNPSLILGMMEIILHILCIPTWKHYFFFDQPVFTSAFETYKQGLSMSKGVRLDFGASRKLCLANTMDYLLKKLC